MESKLKEINAIWGTIDTLYHEAAKKFGLSDSDFYILYILAIAERDVPQKSMYTATGISKSTINSAIKKLESEGIVKLKAIDGRSTQVGLTEEGKKLASESVEKVIRIENRIYDGWSEEERKMMINIYRKFKEQLALEVENLD